MHKKDTEAARANLRVSELQQNSHLWIKWFFEKIGFVKYILTQSGFISLWLEKILHSSPLTHFSF